MKPKGCIASLLRHVAVALLVVRSPASAHHGFDAHTSVRLLDRQTVVIAKMNPTVVAVLLGNDSAGWTGGVTEENKARFHELARRLFVVKAGSRTLAPTTVKVSGEVNADIAFVLNFPAVKSQPFSIEAMFSKDFGPEFTGSIRAYAPPAGPTDRHGKQLGLLELSRRERVLALTSPP